MSNIYDFAACDAMTNHVTRNKYNDLYREAVGVQKELDELKTKGRDRVIFNDLKACQMFKLTGERRSAEAREAVYMRLTREYSYEVSVQRPTAKGSFNANAVNVITGELMEFKRHINVEIVEEK